MKRIWETIGAVVVTAIVVKLLIDAMRPYIPFLLIGLVIYIASVIWYKKRTNW